MTLTQSNSFLTRIKKTFSNKKSQETLTLAQEGNLLDASAILKGEELLVPVDKASSTSSASSIDEDESDIAALEQRLVRQVTEMFSRSMFIYSNTCGRSHILYIIQMVAAVSFI